MTRANQVSGTADELIRAAASRDPVVGFTHGFYRYPARFSPLFARTAITLFTEPGDVVLDPFMGGGTTLVEARALGRTAVGIDISSLADFVTRAKTSLYTARDLARVTAWTEMVVGTMTARQPSNNQGLKRDDRLRNLGDKLTWRLRHALAQGTTQVATLQTEKQRLLARAILLRTGQWALDCRTNSPSVGEMRQSFLANARAMVDGAGDFAGAVRENDPTGATGVASINRSAIGCERDRRVTRHGPPRLILTSPPYPGVHVLYHRWQVLGRRETPAPFWLANVMDGHGASHYTFGSRNSRELTKYFASTREAFRSIATVCDERTIILQLVAFADPVTQLRRYLEALEAAGLEELSLPRQETHDGRVWRSVPNRKWYAGQRGETPSSNEVVLIHRVKNPRSHT